MRNNLSTLEIEQATKVLQEATGRSTLSDAVAWIAEEHDLREGVDLHCILQALTLVSHSMPSVTQATRIIARLVAASALGATPVLFDSGKILSLESYRNPLDLLARKSRGGSLAGISPEAVILAQHENPNSVLILCLAAGLTYTDLRARLGNQIPASANGKWSPSQIRIAFGVIDAIIAGRETTDVPNAIPSRPIEFVIGYATSGWESVEEMRRNGIPYEVLLAQRAVGSSWGLHRNRTSQRHSILVASRLCHELEVRRIEYRRSKSLGGDIKNKEISRLAGGGGHVGLVTFNRSRRPICAVIFSTARDGGTARKAAGRLEKIAPALRVKGAVVLCGPGWADRNETADLARIFGGGIYSDESVSRLADSILEGATLTNGSKGISL